MLARAPLLLPVIAGPLVGVDGDTVDGPLDDGTVEWVRLIGIDTPEEVGPRLRCRPR